MQARWRFRVVMKDCRGEYLAKNGHPIEHHGTDLEALAQAEGILLTRTDDIGHVQAISVGCPAEIADCPGRLLAFVRAPRDGRGWILDGDMMHGSWHRGLEDAVSYGAFRTLGYDSEMRIVNVLGRVTHVVLVPGGRRRMTLY